MVVLIGIVVILLLLLVLEPAEPKGPSRGWTAFVAGSSAVDRDEVRGPRDLRMF